MEQRPGIVPLRPLAFSEILDGAFQALRTNTRTMIGMALVVLAVASVLTLPLQTWLQWSIGRTANRALDAGDVTGALTASLGTLVALIPTTIVTALTTIVLQALLVVAVHAAVLGRRTSPGELWRRVRRRVPAAIGLSLLVLVLVSVATVAATAVFAVPAVLLLVSDRTLGALLFLPAVVVLVVVPTFLYVRTALAAPALLLEDVPVTRALARSWQLTRTGFWRLLAILFVAGVVGALVSGLLVTPFSLVAAALDLVTHNELHTRLLPTLASAAVNALGQTVGGAVVTPWTAAVSALVYLDVRMRREGLDLELRRAADVPGAP